MKTEIYGQLLEDLQKISRHIRRIKHKDQEGALKEHRGSMHLMKVILKNPGIIQKELTERMDMRASSMTEKLRKLEREDMIERFQDEKDKRVQHVYLTEKGKTHLRSRPQMEEEDLKHLFEMLTEDEVKNLQQLLSKITKGLSSTGTSRSTCEDAVEKEGVK